MTTLPLRVKVAIRDHWTKEDSYLQQALKTLRDVLGLDVDVTPDWQILLTQLDSEYADKTDFAAAVAGTVEAWCRAATELLEDDKNEEWTDTLLDKLRLTWSRLRLFVEVASDDQASTAWSDDRGGFLITLPKTQLITPMDLHPLFKSEIKDCFADHHKQLPPYSASPTEDWADLEMDARLHRLSVGGTTGNHLRQRASISSTASRGPAQADFMPKADALPRPDELLQKAPYHLIVYSRGAHEIEIQGSHSATLKFLAEYFKKWRRTNHQISSKPSAVEVKLHQCAFGMGASIDRLVLVSEHKYGGAFILTPTIILSLVEGVLGYKPVYSDAHSWTYRRDTELRA
ncbi:hypothetical protein BDP81DRAFT_422955 [Colletotrichum phormii]|uniref:Uncharacterized protein n=1 Tax=Colletotrichum phormii TaxID=359342 RepID=A0AAI9ZVG7_9PEZI|nr:uncharacterized protein BDP81DRAFT_422955 [Colletotrichum phormii]KAK1638908.1 hypothetical protein BDP81DRAFT_422955 [Colletotrichum phormii]